MCEKYDHQRRINQSTLDCMSCKDNNNYWLDTSGASPRCTQRTRTAKIHNCLKNYFPYDKDECGKCK